jgi:signal transduction histidine kinase
VEIFLSGERYYWLQKTVSTDRGGNPIATVFLCRNVTERTLRLRELSDKNDELDQLNAELENYIEVAALLEEEREKSRVARDMQQTLLKRITRIESELQTLQKKCCEDEDVILKQLDVLTESGRETMADIRSTVEKLVRPEDAKERWDEAKDDLEG